MKTIEINKANWSGETARLKIRKDGSFSLYGYEIGVTVNGDSAKVTIDGREDDMMVHRFTPENGGKWFASSYGVEREDENVSVAVAQVLFNTL
jgi:hypothetical protein